MDVSWQSLPNEVLWRIFAAVEQKSDLVQLQQVCKHWSYHAYQRLYHTACLDRIPALLSYAQTLEHSTYQPRFLVMVVDLDTYIHAGSKNYKKFIHTIARLCPHIVRITTGARNPSQAFCRDLLDLHQQGYLQQLHYLPDLSYKDAHRSEMAYYRLVVAMKASLTHVSVAKNSLSRLFGDDQSETNMWEHLKSFPRLKQLDVSYQGEGFLYEADDFISKCIAPAVNIRLCLTGFSNRLLLWPQVDFDAVKQKPHVKHLSVDICRLTAQDLEYIVGTFTGLASLSMKSGQDQPFETLMITSKNDEADQLYTRCLRFFRYLVSLKRFKVSKLRFTAYDMELFTFWAEHPQLKAVTISRNSMFEPDAHFLTVLTRDREDGYSLIDDEDTKYGGYELELALRHFNFAACYSQILALFKGSAIETLHLRDIASAGSRHTEGGEWHKSMGNSLGYIIDHCAAIKDIQLYQANCRTFDARPAEKQLQKLTFSQCSVYPNALLQLSRSVEYIEKLILHEVAMVNADSLDHSFVIHMPQTAIDNMRIIDYSESIYYLVKLCVSEPSPITRYLHIQAEDILYMEQDAYDAKCLTNKYHNDCIVVHINCKKLKAFGISYDRCFSLISE